MLKNNGENNENITTAIICYSTILKNIESSSFYKPLHA